MRNSKDLVIEMIICVVTIILQVYTLFIGSEYNQFSNYLSVGFGILAAIFAFIYFFNNGSKESTIWHKLFCIALLLSLSISFIRNIQTNKNIIDTISTLCMAIIAAYLTFTKNIGKKMSIILVCVIVLLQISSFTTINDIQFPKSEVKLLGIIADTLLTIVLLNSTFAKYIDKESRK